MVNFKELCNHLTGTKSADTLVQHLRQQAVLEGDICVGAGIAGRAFGDTGHAIEMMVAPGQDTGAGGRAQRGGVHAVLAQAIFRQGFQVCIL